MDNVQAFPLAMEMYFQQGMTLRDYFAAQALEALIIKIPLGELPRQKTTPIYEDVAFSAYEYADAMMEARK